MIPNRVTHVAVEKASSMAGTTRAQRRQDKPLTHRYVPYRRAAMPVEVQRFIPEGPRAALTPEDVDAFVAAAHQSRSLRMQVLGALRSDASNGAEVLLSLTALVVSVVGIAFTAINAGLDTVAGPGVVLLRGVEATGLFVLLALFVSVAGAAHLRKLTAVAWLAAYEDGLTDADRQAEQMQPTRSKGTGRGWWWDRG